MDQPAIIMAAFGLGSAIYAALETDVEEILQRAAFGSLGLLLVTLGVYSI